MRRACKRDPENGDHEQTRDSHPRGLPSIDPGPLSKTADMKKSSDPKNKAREHESARAESSLSKDAAETTLPSRRERQARKKALLRSRGFLRGIETSIERDDDRC